MKFLLTRELGRLAKWLRILGFDARYEASDNKSFCMIEALKQERVVVTRNQRFGTRHGGTVVFVRHDDLLGQMEDLRRELGLKIDSTQLFSRCTICNEVLRPVAKSDVSGKVPAYVFENHEQFMSCPKCSRIYWQGTHWGNVAEVIAKLQ
ncbi:MAG: Mut7-C RNAse domain-containing protein [Candidatus Omnitrophota bacterium]